MGISAKRAGVPGDIMINAGRNISASQVKKHRKCPRSYWFHYVCGVDPTKQGSKYLDLGSSIHDALEDYLKETDDISDMSHNERHIKSKFRKEAAMRDLADDMWSDGFTCCESAAMYLAKRADDVDIADIEGRIEYEMGRPDIQTPVTAILDVTLEQNEVWDWKTGRIRDDTIAEERIQGCIYALAYHAEYGEYPDCIKFIYLKEEEVRTLKAGRDHMDFMLTEARKLQSSRRTGEFEAKPGDQCYWCAYEFYCEASPVGVGSMDWEAFNGRF